MVVLANDIFSGANANDAKIRAPIAAAAGDR